jgi:transcription elongation factor GreA
MKPIYLRKEPKIPFTRDGYRKVLEEKAKLLSERPEAVEHLRKAREMGDLSENGYYKASRQRLSFLDAQIRRVERLVKLGVVVESADSGSVDIGSMVTVSDGKREYTYAIVGGYESDPSKHTISYMSPLGKALMGRKIHDKVEVKAPAGTIIYTVSAITVAYVV